MGRFGLIDRIRLVRALGLRNVSRVVTYRSLLRLGIHPVQRIHSETPAGPFLDPPILSPAPAERSDVGAAALPAFGWCRIAIEGDPPDWFRYIVAGGRLPPDGRAWWTIPDFHPGGGDIKEIWQLSRMDWIPLLVGRALAGDEDALETAECWLDNWNADNPPYEGPNWKCGQEASIRVFHFAMAEMMTRRGSWRAGGIRSLLHAHMLRIAPTTDYARGQANNHATSEAGALFVGGSWLSRLGVSRGRDWMQKGRVMLEELVPELVLPDGSFSQQSVTYHRLMLDTLSTVEAWRRHSDLPPFSQRVRERAAAATRWLHAMVAPSSEGDFPTLGENDGANLFEAFSPRYRDLRPSVELASRLFRKASAYLEIDAVAEGLDVEAGDDVLSTPTSTIFEAGGYGVLRRGPAMAVLRFPRARFRPAHSDALHVDFWVNGQNVLRDGGSYSYAADDVTRDRLTGPEGHCSIEFDGRDPMPRVGTFLRKDWLDTERVDWDVHGDAPTIRVLVVDRHGVRHERSVELESHRLVVRDRVSGFRDRALMRWRLRPGDWRIETSATIVDGRDQLSIDATAPIVRFELKSALESRYYLQVEEIPVLEVEFGQECEIVTRFRWR